MIFAEFSEFIDKKESKGFNRVTSHVESEHLDHSSLIRAPLNLSDSLNSLNFHYI